MEPTVEEEEIYESQVLLLREEWDKDAPQYTVLKSLMIRTLRKEAMDHHWCTISGGGAAEVPSI